MKTAVVDYGIGNLHSVVKALRHVGADVEVTASPSAVAEADRVVLPGVGAFADGMAGLRSRELVGPILDVIRAGRPFLGICLGMQLLLAESEEFGHHAGLQVIPGKVVGLRPVPGAKVPHIGWNAIVPRPGGSFAGSALADLPSETMVYFVHSFTAAPSSESDRLADAYHGGQRISAALARGNVLGCQFHPEKSGEAGLSILRRFMSS